MSTDVAVLSETLFAAWTVNQPQAVFAATGDDDEGDEASK